MSAIKDSVWLLLQADGYLTSADNLYTLGTEQTARNAAYMLALCGEFEIKAVLAYNDKHVPETHSHSKLVDEAGKAGLQVPKFFRGVKDRLYVFEKSSRYDMAFTVRKDVYEQVHEACKTYLSIIATDIITDAAKTLRSILPAGACQGTDEEIVRAWWRNLPD